ncbi:zinc finger matrin-type protein 3 isoform X3 [Leucoraja erinacea]|uniref:zinc finger matrin-type protein 3 isoform X3 n=1 Tax=Leucoraja erinaceus TaxID=7782 RepID=UPI0024544190|nr:zinc finger matrin-type protein 3 isoform X3 [Leucoraja erinacea]
MCQKPYERTALSQNLQPISPAMMPPSSQLLPTQMFKSSKSEIDLLSQEKTPPFDADQDPVLADLCRPLHCKLCNVSLNSTQQAQAHYQSGSSKTTSRVILATANDYCKLCDASFSSPAVAQAHYQGKNHAKRLRLAEAQKSNSLSEATELTKRRQRKEGSAFKVVPNRRNLHGVQNTLGPYFNPRSRQRIPRDLAMCVTPSGQFYCSMCNIGASEEQEFRLHLESKLHKCKVSEQRYRSEMENLGYV